LIIVFLLIIFTNNCKSGHTSPELEKILCEAIFNSEVSKVKLLVEKGVNVNSKVYELVSPLSLVIISGFDTKSPKTTSLSVEERRFNRLLMARLLIDNGADVNNSNGKLSPLSIARIGDDDKDIEELLIRAGANPNTQEDESKHKDRKLNALLLEGYYTLAQISDSKKELDSLEQMKESKKKQLIEGSK
jgi:ankyrin repeat protein